MAYDQEKITFFAKTDARGKNTPFGIKAKDRSKHMYIIGKTGMGKSTLLENMAIQDIQSGEGIAFIDPHGSTAEKLLEYVPEERIEDVLYFAPFDMDYPVSFNVMEDVGADKRHLVVSGLMSTFKKIWVDAWSARMEYILSNTLLALLEYPGSTLLGVNRMLSDPPYRDMVVQNVKDPSVRSFWVDEFAKYNERYMQEAGDAIKNKVGQFTANPLIRNIIGQPKSSFDMRKMMDEKKILIMNLSKGLVGETNANLLGSMLVTRIYLSAMSRANLNANEIAKMPNFYFYVDEFQSFANETFANILSEARKYKLNLTIAHQYIEQMEEEVRDAVFGNVGTTIAFRVGPLDAEFLETIFTPQFLATDLVNLGFAQIYLSLMIDGIGSRPFSAVTLPPIAQSHISFQDQVIAASRRKYAQPRAVVEEVIHVWHTPIKKVLTPKQKFPPKESPKEVPKELQKEPTEQGIERVQNAQVVTTPEQEKKEETNKVEKETLRPQEQMEQTEESKPIEEHEPKQEPKEEQKGEQIQKQTPRTHPHGTPRTAHETPSRPPQRPATNLAELRNVLRSIAGPERPKEQSMESKSEKVHERSGVPKPNMSSGSELKSALAQVLSEAAAEHIKVSSNPPSIKNEQNKVTTPVEHRAPRPPVHTPHHSAPRVAPQGVSAKQVERMLRITGQDNPPFRL